MNTFADDKKTDSTRPENEPEEHSLSSHSLAALCEIGKCLVCFDDAELRMLKILEIVSKVFPLRTVGMNERREEGFVTSFWSATALSPQNLGEVRHHLDHANDYLMNLTPQEHGPSDAVKVFMMTSPSPDASYEESDEASTQPYIVLPLVVEGEQIFGALQFQAYRNLREQDLKFCQKLTSLIGCALHRIQREERERSGFLNAVLDYLEDGIVAGGSEGWGRPYHDMISQKIADRLERIKKELLRSNSELKTFSSTAAHDLNAPLNTISQVTELLAIDLENQLGTESKEYMSFIVAAATRMRTLITRLLEYAQVGARKESPILVDCNQVVEEVLMNLQAAVRATHAKIQKSELPIILGHHGEISQVFQNLIGNALKFRAADRHPEIFISAVNDGTDKILFAVADNGIGIESKYVSKVFEAFKRLHGDSEFEGTGLGLAIVQKIVENHGGEIWVESTFGTGTTIKFNLRRGYSDQNIFH